MIESVFVNTRYKTLTLNPSPSGRGTYALLPHGEGPGMRVKMTVILILQTRSEFSCQNEDHAGDKQPK
jgi:hypothetical protein